jgi:hypothetical protein
MRTGLKMSVKRQVPDDHDGKCRGLWLVGSFRPVSRPRPALSLFLARALSFPSHTLSSQSFKNHLLSHSHTRSSFFTYAFKTSWLKGQSRIRRPHMSFAILSSRKYADIPRGRAWYATFVLYGFQNSSLIPPFS